ncbi:hypothetical protein DRP53_04900 [candidate division WOR-3 bacterium]|uniref:FlgD/Vpr Ig-like domain-containing protein n=1 Tax=candidate division WOR-3 bacterium TaxID=2052148 RepID=A0A660SI37_UNCW3|nr:MAG: hypothetical protein DRP53_04900 [candidate division WOR-3 bacterium]
MLVAILIVGVSMAAVPRDTAPEYGSISGIVRDANTSEPILNAHIVADGPSHGEAYSESLGYYQIRDLLPGIYRVTASAPGYEPAFRDSVMVYANQNTTVNFRLKPSGGLSGIAGRVVNAINNNPILGALVEAWGSGGSGKDNTNSSGEYFIELSPGLYTVKASAVGYRSAIYPDSVEVKAGQITQGIDFALIPDTSGNTGGISGRVTDAQSGLPILNAKIFASGAQGQGWATSESLGYYLIDGLPAGEYQVRAAANGYYPSTYPESVTVFAGQITKNINFALEPAGTSGFAGFPIDGETGLTIPDAKITANGPSGTIVVESNNLGDYLADELKPGVYRITKVTAPGYKDGSYSDPILVMSGWITSFVSPVLYPLPSVEDYAPKGEVINLTACPNPFSNSIRVSWQMAKDDHISLEVFDATGRLVRSLFDRSVKPGSHTIYWDGRDERGYPVAEGVYFFQLTAKSDYTKTLKVLLVR